MIPDFQTLFLPYLKVIADGRPHRTSEIGEKLATTFNLTDDELHEMLPSGSQSRFNNRVAWTTSHFKQAKIVEPVSRGVYQITDRGREVLAENPAKLDLKYLDRFPEHVIFRSKRNNTEDNQKEEFVARQETTTQTPEEGLEATYQTLRNLLIQDLIEKLKITSPLFFERVVIDLLLAMGYGGSRSEAASLTKKTGDEGIDGIIKEDKLGLDAIYVQAKRWEGSVGRPTVQAFSGSLDGVRARKGVLITTSNFSKEALEYVARIEKKIVLIDGEKLADLMIEHNVGVSEAKHFVIKKVDADYFEEE
jgi:restriction system protein